MIDEFDYAEPSCPLCNGKDFYYPQKDSPLGSIPIDRILAKADALFDKNDVRGAGRLLEYWKEEAVTLRDLRGELAMQSELVGYYRKQNERDKGLASIERALALTEYLQQDAFASGATVWINCATAYKAFGMAEQALPLYLRAEAIYQSTLEKGDARFGGLYNNMALTLADLGKSEEAERAYFSALSIMQEVAGGEAECAITYLNLAHLYDTFGQSEKIADCVKKAYDFLHAPQLPHDGYYAFVLEKCAPSFGYFGDVGAYEEFKKEYESIYART